MAGNGSCGWGYDVKMGQVVTGQHIVVYVVEMCWNIHKMSWYVCNSAVLKQANWCNVLVNVCIYNNMCAYVRNILQEPQNGNNSEQVCLHVSIYLWGPNLCTNFFLNSPQCSRSDEWHKLNPSMMQSLISINLLKKLSLSLMVSWSHMCKLCNIVSSQSTHKLICFSHVAMCFGILNTETYLLINLNCWH